MKTLYLFFAIVCFANIAANADTLSVARKGQYSTVVSEGIHSQIASVVNQSLSTKSNVVFSVMNTGILGFDSETGMPQLQWPRNSKNHYLFGSGLWFGALKNVNGIPQKLCVMSFNQSSGNSNFQPTVFADTPDSETVQQTRVFRSTDYNADGTSIENGFSSNWLIWDTDPSAKLFSDGYTGNLVAHPDQRTLHNYPKGAAFISDEDFVTVFDDQNLKLYQAKIDTLKKQGYPLNIRVTQRIYSWSAEQLKDAIIVEQKITNIGNDTLFNCALAPMFDFDITYDNGAGLGSNDNFRYLKEDTALGLSVMWSETNTIEGGKEFGYMGIGFVRTPEIDNQGFPLQSKGSNDRSKQIGAQTIRCSTIQTQPIENSSRYDFITSNVVDTTISQPSDKCFFMSSSGFNFRPKDTVTIAYAICFAKPSVNSEADGSWSDVQGVVSLFRKTRAFYDATFDKKTLGVQGDSKIKSNVNIFPNPTNNHFLVELPDSFTDAEIILMSPIGIQVTKAKPADGRYTLIDTSILASGVYVVCVKSNSGEIITTIPIAITR